MEGLSGGPGGVGGPWLPWLWVKAAAGRHKHQELQSLRSLFSRQGVQGCQCELGAEGRLSPFCSSCPFLCPISLMPTLSLWRCHLFPVQVPARTPLQVIHVQVALTALNSPSAPLGVIQRGSPAPGRNSSPTTVPGAALGRNPAALAEPQGFLSKAQE